MKQQPRVYSDYDGARFILSAIAQWVSRYREAFATSNVLRNCSPEEVAAVARDLKIQPTELASLARKGPNAAALLRKMLLALEVNPHELQRGEPAVMRDLQRLCVTCGYKRQCERELAAGTAAGKFQAYCPNAFTLELLLSAKH